MQIDQESLTFFVFGCWNKDETGPRDIVPRDVVPRDVVLEHLQTKTGTGIYDFGIVAGDNIYPHVLTTTNVIKKKEYNHEVIVSGFAALDNVNAPVKMVLGNHNVLNVTWKPNMGIKEYEEHVSKLSKNISLILENKVENRGIANVWYLDSNEATKIADFINTTINNAIEDFEASTWNIIVGHHPLFSIKTKYVSGIVDESKDKVALLNDFDNIMTAISKLKNPVYLCADVHNFQVGVIRYKGVSLPMVVAGTGGAQPDPIANDLKTYSHPYNGEKVEYQVFGQENPYGYCGVKLTKEGNLTLRYHKVLDPTSLEALYETYEYKLKYF